MGWPGSDQVQLEITFPLHHTRAFAVEVFCSCLSVHSAVGNELLLPNCSIQLSLCASMLLLQAPVLPS